jgi:hypothetical protein
MKNNCKNRALNFIRKKNWIRSLGVISFSIEIASDLMDDFEFVDEYIRTSIIKMYDSVNKSIRANYDYEVVDVQKGFVGNDFIDGITTIRIRIKKI